MISARRRHLALPALTVLFAAVSCSPSEDVAVPSPEGAAARYCKALHQELPDTVDGLKRATAEPVSDFTAMWGDPAVKLRCGVPKPDVLTHGSEHYNPYADAAEVNGVRWLFEKQDDGYRFTTVLRKAYVEVTVPGKYAPEVDALTDLAGAVKKTVPVGV
ncbi:DUF3515 domain-containing protein [Streptomyces libani]|uniref:DUF3515 domain-containing protein n=2 Tax=Streptomyces nigrescens TaxID=1920 RepID=A0A640THW1_STRNI|nr:MULTISPECIES: DUF3515 domain-containing protein [Streptomyces]MYT13511.1 DUF3515 family protein [Streptomyces sp. SID4951]AWN29720.1 DUF3515 domain-containing protein [Streptomyces sp. NEAU-S7GS2]WAT96469.1 DUF3515 domain-containing protein [Streptomyces libani subsp. libani]WAU04380.1 DUF3515 domain-containing protein [Streptomyces nigrescens]SCK52410.1 Protein of unknown function (DUF3515) [Streptomyces sp. SceaMP-e96]